MGSGTELNNGHANVEATGTCSRAISMQPMKRMDERMVSAGLLCMAWPCALATSLLRWVRVGSERAGKAQYDKQHCRALCVLIVIEIVLFCQLCFYSFRIMPPIFAFYLQSNHVLVRFYSLSLLSVPQKFFCCVCVFLSFFP